MKYGGTRLRSGGRAELGSLPKDFVERGQERLFARLPRGVRRRPGRCDVVPERLVCNQLSPNFIPVIADAAQVPLDRTLVTGPETGHTGTVDIGIGLRRLVEEEAAGGAVALGASGTYAFGAAVLCPPIRRRTP